MHDMHITWWLLACIFCFCFLFLSIPESCEECCFDTSTSGRQKKILCVCVWMSVLCMWWRCVMAALFEWRRSNEATNKNKNKNKLHESSLIVQLLWRRRNRICRLRLQLFFLSLRGIDDAGVEMKWQQIRRCGNGRAGAKQKQKPTLKWIRADVLRGANESREKEMNVHVRPTTTCATKRQTQRWIGSLRLW